MPDICKYEGNQVLLVEGKSDCHSILALCKFFNLPQTFGIYQCGNDIGVLKRLNALIIQPATPISVGIVMDADAPDVAGRWIQIREKIKNHEYTFPESPDTHGTIITGSNDKPNIGIWLMPNNQNPGMLEDFLIQMAEQNAISAAKKCLETALNIGVTTFKEAHFSKALIHTYLAWQDEPGKPLGQSITAHSLKPDTDNAKKFIDWLKRLFYFEINEL
jgi:hypothetical protein